MSPRPFYRPELDALRFFAFLAVFATHVIPSAPAFYADSLHLPSWLATICATASKAGMGGVVLFFMLSSYLITALLIREQVKAGMIDLLAFYKRRALRIWPLYFTFLAFCAFIVPLFGHWHALPTHHLWGFATFTENWVIYFKGGPLTPAVPLWSVSVEEQFYIVWPLLIVSLGIHRIPVVAGWSAMVAMVARLYMVGGGADDSQIWQSTLSHVDSIAFGALIAYYTRNGLPTVPNSLRLKLVALGLVLPIAARYWAPTEVYRYPVVTMGCTMILLGVMGWDMPKNRATGALVYLGKISFGLYVFHIGWIWTLDALLPKVAFVLPASFVLTVATAALSYRYLETPFLHLKERFAVVPSRAV